MNNATAAFLQRRQHRQARHTAKRQARCRAWRRAAAACPSRGQAVLLELCKTIHHFFPHLFDQLRQLEDCRQKSDYTLAEILLAGILLFVFQQGSRNAFNNQRTEVKFRNHYERLFKLRLPHLDTVHHVLCRLPETVLERLKHALVKTLLEKKVLHKYRLFGRWFVVAVDATGVASFSERHCAQCLHRTSSTGKTTYFHPVLEAKLIAANGFAISLATEWIANPTGEYDKQDCERKAFARLAAQLKQQYPRLPLCLTADGLYPYQGFFEICREAGWAFIITFQDGNLPTVWEDVRGLLPLTPAQCRHERRYHGSTTIEQTWRWVNHLASGGHTLVGLESVETVPPARPGREFHPPPLRPSDQPDGDRPHRGDARPHRPVALEDRKRRLQYPKAPRLRLGASVCPGQWASGEKLLSMPANRSPDQSVNDSQHELSDPLARQDDLPPPVAVSAGVPPGGRPQPEPARRPAPPADPNPVALRHREIACSAIQAPPVNPLGR